MTTKEGAIRAFESCISHSIDEEITEAISQIHHIARLRLEDLVHD